MLKKVQIFKALDIEIKKQKGPASLKDPYKGHHSLKEELSQPGISVIAEVAGGSPLRGQVRDNYRPSTHARSLLENGASAISVATDRFLYWGDDRHLPEVRAQAKVPLLRRDFIFEEYQIEESKILGADAIYLMPCLLEPERLKDLLKLAVAKSLDVVFEVFNEQDLERALEVGAEIVCVVGRNIDTFEPSFERALELVQKVPEDQCFRMVEAGISSQVQIQQLEAVGVHGVIVGEVFLDEFYPGKRLAQILAGIEPARKSGKSKPKSETPEEIDPKQSTDKAPSPKPKKGAKSPDTLENADQHPVNGTPSKKKALSGKQSVLNQKEKGETTPTEKEVDMRACGKKADAKQPVEKKGAAKPAASKKAADSKAPTKKIVEKAVSAVKPKSPAKATADKTVKPKTAPAKATDKAKNTKAPVTAKKPTSKEKPAPAKADTKVTPKPKATPEKKATTAAKKPAPKKPEVKKADPKKPAATKPAPAKKPSSAPKAPAKKPAAAPTKAPSTKKAEPKKAEKKPVAPAKKADAKTPAKKATPTGKKK